VGEGLPRYFLISEEDGYLAVTCPWGNQLRGYALPPRVAWRYDWKPAPGSPEDKLYEEFLIAKPLVLEQGGQGPRWSSRLDF